MDTRGVSRIIAAMALSVAFVAGCGSNPGKIRAEMQHYTDLRQYADARAVNAKHNPGGIPKTDEEAVKEEMIRDVVNPTEIKDISGRLTGKVADLVKAGKFDEARDVVWTPIPNLVPDVDKAVSDVKGKLLREEINRAQFVATTNEMAKAVAAAVESKDFAGARRVLASVRPVRTYPSKIEGALVAVEKALAGARVPADETAKSVASAKALLADIFADAAIRTDTVQAGDEFKPDDRPYRERLNAFGELLKKQGVSPADRDKAVSAINDVAAPAFRALWLPQEPCDLAPPAAIGTSKLNELVAEAKSNLYETIVVPAQIAHRAAALRDKVRPLLDAGQLDEARDAIHYFGVTGYPEVDDPVFAVKLGLLNARVNMAEWKKRSVLLDAAVKSALARCDLDAASDAIAADKAVPAYGRAVGKALDVAAAETVKLGCNAEGAGDVVAGAHESLCGVIAPRPDADREERIMEAYLREVAGIEDERCGDKAEPDWSAVSNALANAAAWLVADDMPRKDAEELMADVMAGFKALAGGMVDSGPAALTTEELNNRLSDFKSELSARVAAGVSAKMEAAKIVAEAASLPPDELEARLRRLKESSAGKVSTEFAETLSAQTAEAAQEKIAEAKIREDAVEKAAAEARAEEERLRDLALEMAERAALAVDFDARVNGLVEAVSDRTEPELNRILGDGARILRLRRAGARIGKADATSLLVAAIYMGYDDVASLALALGADIDGAAAKDALRRPALLLAMQYGYRGRAASILEKASRNAADALGDGAMHYAVRGGNGGALVELLRLGIDAGRPGANGATPIVLAADLGYAGFVQALVPFSDLEKADKEGFTALLRAAQSGRADIVRNLAAAGANLAATTVEGDGAIELAAKANAPELLAWLLDDRKVAPTPRVVSQLVIAGNVPTLQTMVAHGARLRDEHLAVAVKRGDFPMVKYLVNQGMDVNAESVLNICRENDGGADSGSNDGTYYGPDGENIRTFLREQGQRL